MLLDNHGWITGRLAWSDKLDPVYKRGVIINFLEHLPLFKVPNYNGGVLAGGRNELIALRDVDVRNVVAVAMQRRLKSQRLLVPHLDDSKGRLV